MFASCGSNESESSSSTIKIDNLEVMTEDLESTYTWDDAMKACAVLGDGWRLPTKDELNLLYENKEKIGGFANDYYWSSTEFGSYGFAWQQLFSIGTQPYLEKKDAAYVRAIRAF